MKKTLLILALPLWALLKTAAATPAETLVSNIETQVASLTTEQKSRLLAAAEEYLSQLPAAVESSKNMSDIVTKKSQLNAAFDSRLQDILTDEQYTAFVEGTEQRMHERAEQLKQL